MTFREVPAEDLSLNPMIMIGGRMVADRAGNEEARYGGDISCFQECGLFDLAETAQIKSVI